MVPIALSVTIMFRQMITCICILFPPSHEISSSGIVPYAFHSYPFEILWRSQVTSFLSFLNLIKVLGSRQWGSVRPTFPPSAFLTPWVSGDRWEGCVIGCFARRSQRCRRWRGVWCGGVPSPSLVSGLLSNFLRCAVRIKF